MARCFLNEFLVAALVLLLAAGAWQRNGTWATELALWGDAVAKAPGKPRANVNLGVVYAGMLRYDKAQEAFQEALRRNPQYVEGLANLASVFKNVGRLDEAFQYYRRALEIRPNYALGHYNLGNLYRLTGQQELALEAWHGALGAEPAHLDSLMQLKLAYLRRGDFDGICALLERSVEHDPGFVDGWREWAGIRRGQLLTEQAISIWKRAIEALPPPPEPWAEYGADEQQLRQRRVAAIPLHGLGLMLLDNGRAEEAGTYIEQAFQLDDRNIEVTIDFARALGRTGRTDVALDLIRQVVQVAPDNLRARGVLSALQRGQVP